MSSNIGRLILTSGTFQLVRVGILQQVLLLGSRFSGVFLAEVWFEYWSKLMLSRSFTHPISVCATVYRRATLPCVAVTGMTARGLMKPK